MLDGIATEYGRERPEPARPALRAGGDKVIILVILVAVALMAWPPAARANCGVTQNGMPEESLLESFGPRWVELAGLRPLLAKAGVAINGTYYAEVFGNPVGGFKQGAAYDGVLDVRIDADMHKLGLWKGLCFHTNGLQIHGQGITAADIGGLMTVSSLEAIPATRLEDLWLEQHLLSNRLSVRFGQLRAGNEFIVSRGGGFFINSTFGWPALPDADLPSGGPAYPLATPGARLAIDPSDQFGVLVGVYNGDPADPNCPDNPQVCNNDGLDFALDDPPLLMIEGAYNYGREGLTGRIKIGGWNHFGDFPPISVSARRSLDNNYSLYAVIDQVIWRAPESADAQAIALFGRIMGAPSDRNLVDFYADGGITVSGIIPRRPNDSFAVGVAYTGINSDTDFSAKSTFQALVEFCYTTQLAPGWTLQPDVQYLWQSGNVPSDLSLEDALVFGVRSSINF
jgi:porin